MTRERLQELSEEVLKRIAQREGIHNLDHFDREKVIDLILEALEEDRTERDKINNAAMRLEHKKYDILRDEELIILSQDEFPLPEDYNETRIVALLRDPRWVYAYWDINKAEYEKLEEEPFFEGYFLRVYEFHGDQVTKGNTVDYFEIPIDKNDDSWYINLNHTGSDYCVELCCKVMHEERSLAMSNKVHSPLGYFARNKEEFLNDSDTMVLMLSGLWDYDEQDHRRDEIPQRIISILDTHNIEI